MNPASLQNKFAAVSEHWRPKIIANLNGQHVKIVKSKGVFPWHTHYEEDELFLVWKGRFRVEFRTHVAELGPGDFVVVPRGIEHRTSADEEAEVIVFEPEGVLNTGDVVDAVYTAPIGDTI